MAETLQYVYGHSEPLIKVYKNGILHDELEFPETLQPNGTTIYWIEKSLYDEVMPISIDFTNYNEIVLKNSLGWRGFINMDYARWMNNDNIMNNLKKAFDYEDDGFTLILYPHKENRRCKYEVKRIPNSQLTIKMKRGGINAIGNEGIEIQYQTVNLYKYVDIYDPNAVQYTGTYIHQRTGVINS